MIRFPPTTIALSENDVDFHLCQIQIKEQLYAQGFTKEEVRRYYADLYGHRDGHQSDQETTSIDLLNLSSPKLRTGSSQSGGDRVTRNQETRKPSDNFSLQTVSSRETVHSSENPPATCPEQQSSAAKSNPSSPGLPVSIPYRHFAVRQSSLLRIIHNAGSQPSSAPSTSSDRDNRPRDDGQDEYEDKDEDEGDEGDEEFGRATFLQSPATRTRSYRPRSKTYPYTESEAEPPSPSIGSNDEPSSSPPLVPLSNPSGQLAFRSLVSSPQEQCPSPHVQSPLYRSEPDVSSPLTLPPPLSIHRRTSSWQFVIPDRTRPVINSTANHDKALHPSSPQAPVHPDSNLEATDTSVITHTDLVPSTAITYPHRLIISDAEESNKHMASVPDHLTSTTANLVSTSPRQSALSSDSAESPNQAPAQTEPQNHDRHALAFGVYNDNFPAETQPQTPAELQSPRRGAVPERNLAYTAPPGQIRTTGRPYRTGHDNSESTAQSPTLRAATIRERRARELGRWRTIRLESFRNGAWSEELGRGDDAGEATRFDMGLDGPHSPQVERRRVDDFQESDQEEVPRVMRGRAQFLRLRRAEQTDWRAGFEADRVGEENFETADPGE